MVGQQCRLACVAALVTLVTVAASQPLHNTSPDEVGAVDPLQYLLVQRLLNARLAADGAKPVSAEEALARDLVLLAHAAAANIGYHKLPVAASAVKTYCHLDNNRQCRDACFHLGDSACIDGNMAGNGNDNAFLEGGFHPGK